MSHLQIARRGAGSPVVFIHGCPTTVDVFDGVTRIVEAEHEVFVVSLPGYGSSPPLRPGWGMDDLHDALAETIGAVGAKGAWLVGISAGSYHALAMAADPRVDAAGVFALGGALGFTEERDALNGFADAVLAGAPLAAIAGPRFLSETTRGTRPDLVRRVEAWLDATSPENLAAELRALAGAPDLGKLVATLAIPIVARVGALDVATPRAKSEEIVRVAKRGALQIVDGAAHALVYEDERGTAEAILAAASGRPRY